MSVVNETLPSGIVFDIQSFSVHDGPGCRTTVFMKGCSLRCKWCANPESWQTQPELLYVAGKCKYGTGCRRCLASCRSGALREVAGELQPEWETCRTCSEKSCAAACPQEALRICGQPYEPERLLARLQRDRAYWGSGGGVTFSGGEPLLQREFLLDCLQRCRKAYIHTAIETSALAPQEDFLAVMEWIDFAFIDFKHSDAALHRAGTAVDNERILSNIAALTATNWPGRLVLRTPVIPGFNDDVANAAATIDWMQQAGVAEINLLPFHRLGDSKWTQLGRRYPYAEQQSLETEMLEELQEYYLERGIACYIGSETPF